MNDEQIISLYLSRDQRAIAQTSTQYGSYCQQIAMRILGSSQDAEETVNDTWLHTWDSIPPNHPSVLKLYLAKITRNLAFSRYRSNAAQKRGNGEIETALEELEECISSHEGIDDELNKAELLDTIRKFLGSLPAKQRNIFIRRYFFVETTTQIAQQYGIQESNVRMTLSRIRKKLKAHLIKEGYDL